MITILFLVSAVKLIIDINNLKSNLVSQTKMQSLLLKEYLVTPIIFDDKEGLEDILQKINIFDYLFGIVVYDRDGLKYANYLKQGYDYEFPERKHNIGDVISGDRIHATGDIVFQNEKIGEIHLLGTTDLLDKQINSTILIYFISIVVLSIIIWLLSGWLQKFISNPILNLKKQTIDIAEKQNYSLRLDQDSEDEIGDLSREFNNLLDQISIERTKRDKFQQEIKDQFDIFLSILRSFPELIYVSDMDTYEILFTNHAHKRMFGKDLTGRCCYKELYGFDNPCDFCNNKILKEENDQIVWELHNDMLNRDFMVTDKAITWPDGRRVRFEVAVDITKRKKIEKELLELNVVLEQKVADRTALLEDNNKRLSEIINQFAGREYRIRELNDKIKELKQKLQENRA